MVATLPLAGLLISLVAGPSGADDISWEVPRGCPDRASLRRTITRRLGRKLKPGELTLVGHIVAGAGPPPFELRLELTVDGHTQVRTLTGERCGPLADATALLVALAVAPADPTPPPLDANPPASPIDATPPASPVDATPPANPVDATPPPTATDAPLANEAATTDPPTDAPATAEPDPQPAPTPPPTATNITPPPPTRDTPSPRRRRPGALLRLHGGPELGAVPAISGALGLAAGLLWRRARLELQGTWLAPRTEVRGANSVQVSVLAVGVHGCARPGRAPLEFPLCAGLEAGPARGHGHGPGAQTATSLWLAGVASAGLAWHLHPRLALALTAQMAVPLVYPHFELRDPDATQPVPLFTPAPVTGRLLVGLEARLGDPW